MRPTTIHETPILNPGECHRCHCNELAEGREYFVDTGIDVEWVGVLYLCNLCLADLVRVTPDILHKSIVDAAAEAQSNFIAEAERKDRQYEEIVSALTSMGLTVEALLNLQAAKLEPVEDVVEEEKEKHPISLSSIKLGL